MTAKLHALFLDSEMANWVVMPKTTDALLKRKPILILAAVAVVCFSVYCIMDFGSMARRNHTQRRPLRSSGRNRGRCSMTSPAQSSAGTGRYGSTSGWVSSGGIGGTSGGTR